MEYTNLTYKEIKALLKGRNTTIKVYTDFNFPVKLTQTAAINLLERMESHYKAPPVVTEIVSDVIHKGAPFRIVFLKSRDI